MRTPKQTGADPAPCKAEGLHQKGGGHKVGGFTPAKCYSVQMTESRYWLEVVRQHQTSWTDPV